jgi:preprotein translocase subunit SecA
MVTTPSAELQRTWSAARPALPTGLDAAAVRAGRHFAQRHWRLGRLRGDALRVDERGLQFRDLSEPALNRKLAEAREGIRRRLPEPDAVVDGLAVVAEACWRECGLRPHLEQIIAALAVRRGCLIEMATGEGKTLAVGLAAVIAGWAGKPCHVLTANDYLAARDVESLGPLYRRCGLRAGCVTGEMQPAERRANYDCDVAYSTPREVTADYLRDRLALGLLADGSRRLLHLLGRVGKAPEIVQRGLHTAIVDEADSALIDEAVTPLIISQRVPNPLLTDAVMTAHGMAAGLRRGCDYLPDELHREIKIPPATLRRLESEASSLPATWSGPHRRMELLRQALVAREFFKRDKDYVVEENEIVIVDEFTGRLMPQRMWQQGLHQAIEVKEGIAPGDVSQTLARLSFQRFFRRYRRLSGLSGTVAEAAAEFWFVYGLPMVRVPTHRPCIRKQWAGRYFADAEGKWTALLAETERLHAQGRPLLIGTRTIAASEEIARRLRERGLGFELLNATRHREEARIVAIAGERSRITIATNMAGRGTDITLGPGVRELGGLHVIAAEPNESGRIDRQLFGRAGRQGDPGSARMFVSMEDELLEGPVPGFVRRRIAEVLRVGAPGARRIAAAITKRAQRIMERKAFEQRRAVMEHDDWIEEALSFAGR